MLNIEAVLAQELKHTLLKHATLPPAGTRLASYQPSGCGVPLKLRRKHFGARGLRVIFGKAQIALSV